MATTQAAHMAGVFKARLVQVYTAMGAENLGRDFPSEPNPFSPGSTNHYSFDFGSRAAAEVRANG